MGSSSSQRMRNRAPCSVFICVLLCVSTVSVPSLSYAQTAPAFACDIDSNPSLAKLGFCDTKTGIELRVRDLVGRLNLQEKIGFLVSGANGVARLGIPKYEWWSEALHGVSNVGPGTRFADPILGATSFPQVILTAASFNVSLFQTIGQVVSTEARAMYNVGLAGLTFWSPNINIVRDPRWGRTQETPGEDPLLASKYGVAYVKGLQETGARDPNSLKVAACCKHYTAYDLDNWKGIERYTFNAVVNKQDMDDTFQPPFKSCVTEGNVASVMCSYNQVNGKPTCADPDLLSSVVRGQWKLNGYIVADCDSVEVMFNKQHFTKTPAESSARSILAGLDLDCGTFLAEHTGDAIKANLINETAIDRAISNNFATLMRLGFFDGNPKKRMFGQLGPNDVCKPQHQELAAEAARQGIVLLKNAPRSLPLSPSAIKKLAVIGPNANATRAMIGNYQGVPCKYTSPLQGLAATVSTTYHSGCSDMKCNTAQVDEAAKMAAQADATVLVVGSDLSIEAESLDRVDLTLPGRQQELVTQVAKAAKGPVILVIMSGGGFDVTFAKNDNKITSIMWVGYPGQDGGIAIADVIFGRHNPSGKLPITWYPQSYVEKVPMTNMNMRPDNSTGYPGRTYRFYTGETVYPFGAGLSFTNFTHQMVKAPKLLSISLPKTHACGSSKCQTLDAVGPHCANAAADANATSGSEAFDVHVNVKNDGDVEGTETVFLFMTPPEGSVKGSPVKHLIGFEKVRLGKKEEGVVRFRVEVCKDLSLADETGTRKVALGEYVLHVGSLTHSLSVRV